MSWVGSVSEWALTLAVIVSTTITILMLTAPSAYSQFDLGKFTENDFTDEDKKDSERSGYDYFQKYKDTDGNLPVETNIQVVVLGDIGRSPRMQYHALSIASCGGQVDLVGYVESDVHPDIQASRFVNVVPIRPFPERLRSKGEFGFLITAPFKVTWQICSLYYALAYRSKACKWMLVQNPPSIPTLAIAQLVCFCRNTRLVIDWHNFGYSILALRLGPNHPLVRLAEWYEEYFSRGATAHFCVTNAMAKVLKRKWDITASPLHDRPPKHFQPLSTEQRSKTLHRLPYMPLWANELISHQNRLIVSSTSWTPDEDFSILLDALVDYSATSGDDSSLPYLNVVITGKGPLKKHYTSHIDKLTNEHRLLKVNIKTVWLSTEDYASLLGSADLGISLHTSSSGVDLPMKVVDMFGTGLPVAGWSKFEAWPELVREGENGRGFESAGQLSAILQELFGGDGHELQKLRDGALKECHRRWDDEWMPIAGQLFQLKP